MKVILKQDVSKLGKRGEMIDVADGYGRNFLLPRGLAEEATAGKMKEWEDQQEVKKNKASRAEAQATALKKHLQGRRVTVKVSIGEGGKLFGSVTAAQVADAISAQLDARVDKKDVRLAEAIRQIGVFPFSVKLHPGIEASMSVSVESA